MILLSYPIGNVFSRQAARAMQDAGLLAEFWTSLHWSEDARALRWLPGPLTRQLQRRGLPASVAARTHGSPLREAGRLLAQGAGARWLTRHEAGPCSVDAVFHAMDQAAARRVRRLARPPGAALRGVYAYEDGAAATFREARRQGLKCFYDLPIGYWRAGQRIFAEEAECVPAWAATLTGRGDSAAKLARKEEELAGADAVIVASTFTRQTLGEAPGLRAPVYVVPYGAPAVPPDLSPPSPPRTDGAPLRVLFVGILSQRKGISYLLEATASLGRHVELTLLGMKPAADCPALDAAARAHRWIPSVPHAGVLAEMERQDVLVFPSLFEGFGLVILEAMSRGLPVVTTAHTAGPDLIEDGRDGFLVPIRSAAAIAEKLETLHRDRARLAAMREAACAKAAAWTWDTYRRLLVQRLAAMLAPPASP